MNERILEIARESGLLVHNPAGVPTKLEKFAQLIVQECANICDKIYFDRYPDAEDFERSEEGDAIKKHFGVEE